MKAEYVKREMWFLTRAEMTGWPYYHSLGLLEILWGLNRRRKGFVIQCRRLVPYLIKTFNSHPDLTVRHREEGEIQCHQPTCKIKDKDRWVRNQIQFCGSLDTHFITTRSISHATHCHRKAPATVLSGEHLSGKEAETSVICSFSKSLFLVFSASSSAADYLLPLLPKGHLIQCLIPT